MATKQCDPVTALRRSAFYALVPSAAEVEQLRQAALTVVNCDRYLRIQEPLAALLYQPIEFYEDLPAEVTVYANAWCRRFCNTLCERLPREVRDLIYGYLVTDKQIPVGWHCRVGRFYIDRSVDKPTEFVYDAEWLGLQVTRELAQHCYRTLQFQFELLPEELIRRDGRDRWSSWFEEVDAHGSNRYDLVRNVSVFIEERGDLRAVSGGITICEEGMQALLRLKPRARITFNIHPDAIDHLRHLRDERGPAFMSVVDSLRPQLKQLAEADYGVKVALFEPNRSHYGSDGYEPNWFPSTSHKGSYQCERDYFPTTLQEFYDNRTWRPLDRLESMCGIYDLKGLIGPPPGTWIPEFPGQQRPESPWPPARYGYEVDSDTWFNASSHTWFNASSHASAEDITATHPHRAKIKQKWLPHPPTHLCSDDSSAYSDYHEYLDDKGDFFFKGDFYKSPTKTNIRQ